MNPDPTPYDILDIPVFAYVPGLKAWLAVLALALCSFGVIYFFLRRTKRLKSEPFLSLRNQLAQLECAAPPSLASLSSISLKMRRLLATYIPTQCAQLAESSAAELRQRALQVSSNNLRTILECLAQIDEARYSGAGVRPGALKTLREALIALEFELPVLKA